MTSTRVAIVGGGLSGLYAAYLLSSAGLTDYVVLEAKPLPGGRILSLDVGTPAAGMPSDDVGGDTFDLGPTWFWPEYQPRLSHLVESLGLQRFAQYETGDMLVERAAGAPARTHGFQNVPASMRVHGGMGALISALRRALEPSRLRLGCDVRQLVRNDAGITLNVSDASGSETAWHADYVLLATPPRIATSRIAFSPPLPEALQRAWQGTDTWMAPHAKYVAVYDTAFWRDNGLSGEARSQRGPMVEIHDASAPDGRGALFGFVGVPASARATLPEAVLLAQCRAQLERLFGPKAAAPVVHVIQDWAQDPWVATPRDHNAYGAHNAAPTATPAAGEWQGRLIGVASEWSPQYPGYLAGAVEAAEIGVSTLLQRAEFS